MVDLSFITYDDVANDQAEKLREPVPVGEYFAKIIASEKVTTKSGTGWFLKLTWEINGHVDSGEHKNRRVWQKLNIKNSSAAAERVARKELDNIRKASGITVLNDSTELHGRELIIGVKIEPAEGQYAASNDISYVKSTKHAPKKDNLSAAEISNAANAPPPPNKDLDDEIPF